MLLQKNKIIILHGHCLVEQKKQKVTNHALSV